MQYDDQLLKPVREVWEHHCQNLSEALDETSRELKNLLRLDEHHRHGHEEKHLKETMGPMAGRALNLASLSEVLGSSASARCLPEERLKRIHNLVADLEHQLKACARIPDGYPIMSIEDDEEAIHQAAEDHLDKMAQIFRDLRVAQLEVRAKYDPGVHDAMYANFTWRQLSPSELRLCPPFLIVAEVQSETGPVLRKAMSLLESRKPFKVVVLRSSLRKVYSPTADPSVPATMAVETLPLAMRGVHFLQTCIAAPDYTRRLFEVLTSPRPSLVSLLAQRDGEDEEDFHLRAERAMRSKAFPVVLYDPDRAKGFVSCFDLSSNPEGSEAYTFADFALFEEEFAGEFSEPPAGVHADNLVPVAEFLELTRHQRMGKLPVVYAPGPDGEGTPKVVSSPIVTQASDQQHLWKTLMEIAGVDNPHVKSTKANLQAAFGAEQKAMKESLQQNLEKDRSTHEKMTMASAVQKLVANLTGVDPSRIDLQQLLVERPETKKPES